MSGNVPKIWSKKFNLIRNIIKNPIFSKNWIFLYTFQTVKIYDFLV